jgi:excisionase family DNA binding protein
VDDVMAGQDRKQDEIMIPNPVERPTITVEEAAEILGIGRSAAYAAIHRGELAAIRIGRTLKVPTAPLLKMLGIHPA